MFFKTRLTIIACLILFSFPYLLENGNIKNLLKLKSENTSDTIYSGQISIHASILTFALPNASVKFSIIDSINQITQLILEASTDLNGELIIDRLPIISNFVGINDFSKFQKEENQLIISNNGTASDHSILFKTNLKLSKQGFIIDMNGKLIETINLIFNPILQAYEGIWKGSVHKSGTYIFYAETPKGTIAGKINHVSGLPQISSQLSFNSSSLVKQRLKESTLIFSKYKIEVSSEVSEYFQKFVYVYEQTAQGFSFSLDHLPIANARIDGVVTINRTTVAPNAFMLWSSLISDNIFTTFTDANGYYSKDDVIVPIDDLFTNPESSRYYLTINIGDSITFKIDPVTVISGELVTTDCNINIL